jgi:hypothetical protein
LSGGRYTSSRRRGAKSPFPTAVPRLARLDFSLPSKITVGYDLSVNYDIFTGAEELGKRTPALRSIRKEGLSLPRHCLRVIVPRMVVA